MRDTATTRYGGLLILPLALVLAGCGSANEGPERHQLTGTVTYDGEPVPKGTIELVPDADAGNPGPAAYADINDGRYSTSAEKGIMGGPYLLRISGYDGVATLDAQEGENLRGEPLFPPYQMEADLPQETGSFDINVPASASQRTPEAPPDA